ncbi:hypothetical protein ES703_47219 [subsurface metagenome]
MKIDEAIRILTADKSDEVATEMEDIDGALQLGIEALEFLEKWRSKAEIQPFPLLRSETLE